MLTKMLKQKLCPLFSLALAFGCGKKISEVEAGPVPTSINQAQELDPLLILELIEKQGVKKSFTIPRDGIFKLPAKLFIQSGRGPGRRVSITYNKEAGPDNIYEFKCTYRSRTEVDNLPLQNCTDSLGRDYGDVSDEVFTLDQGKQVEMNLLNPNGSDLEIHAWYEVEWK